MCLTTKEYIQASQLRLTDEICYNHENAYPVNLKFITNNAHYMWLFVFRSVASLCGFLQCWDCVRPRRVNKLETKLLIGNGDILLLAGS